MFYDRRHPVLKPALFAQDLLSCQPDYLSSKDYRSEISENGEFALKLNIGSLPINQK